MSENRNSIYSLNKEHINKEKYSVNINDKISNIIDYKNYYLNINFNKIVYIDKDNHNNYAYKKDYDVFVIGFIYEDDYSKFEEEFMKTVRLNK